MRLLYNLLIMCGQLKRETSTGSGDTGFACETGRCEYLTAVEDGPSPEDHIDLVDELAKDFDLMYTLMRKETDSLKLAESSMFDQIHEEIGEGLPNNRATRRFTGKSLEHGFGELEQTSKELSIMLIRSEFGESWDSYPAIETDIKALEQFEVKVVDMLNDNTNFRKDEPESSLTDDYEVITLTELLMRTTLARFQINNPALADSLYQIDNLVELPDSIQRLIASDVLRGKAASVVLQHVTRSIDSKADEETHGDQLFEYMTREGLAKDSRRFFQDAALGIAAVKDIVCPLNEFGICRNLLDNLGIPEDVARDMDRYHRSCEADAIIRLKGFTSRFGPDPLKINWKKVHHNNQQSGKVSSKRKHAQVSQIEISSESTEASQEAKLPFSSVVAKVSGCSIEVDPNNEEAVSACIKEVLESDVFHEYIQKHRAQGIEEFLSHAVRAILFSHNKEGSIRKVLSSKREYSGGHSAFLYRLSGQELAGSGGGGIAKDTRVFFFPFSEGKKRTVVFTGVHHKSDIKKGYPESVYSFLV